MCLDSATRQMLGYDKVLRLVGEILALRETHDHHGRSVAVLAQRLAQAAGLSPDQVSLIGVGAHLHDIGKVLIRKDLLNMPRKLTAEEVSEMRLHAMYGWVIVEKSGFEPVICDVVRYHHERYDGNGYPDRLQAEDIPLAARIVSICDVYQSLVSQRAYRTAYTSHFACSYMLSESGKAFDASLLDLFFEKVLSP